VGEFTTELTADDQTQYDTAVTIQEWLRMEKEYSLNVSERGSPIADTFIFEMDAGYCEYFATSMVAMLRSQDIPARYTVGYSTGQPVGEDTYQVRGMNAHAWVEVYFEDIGWVKFDPTPGDSRLAQQEQALEAQGEDYDIEEQGSPGEQFEPGEIQEQGGETDDIDSESGDGPGDDSSDNGTSDGDEDSGDENSGDDDTDGTDGETGEEADVTTDDGETGYKTSLNRSAVPDSAVEVTVTQDGEPAPNREVYFNGELIGSTDSAGTVTGTVPYADELRITVGDANPSAVELTGTVAGDDVLNSPRRGDGPTLLTAALDEPEAVQDNDSQGDTYQIETNATISVTGDTVPGEEVEVTATVDDVPVSEGTVTMDGETVGETDGSGRATVVLPEETGNTTLAVERGPVIGETTLSVSGLSVTVDSRLPVAVPYDSATVEVQYGDEPVATAPVMVDGKQVTTTGHDGTATVQLPLSSDATITTSYRGQTAETTVSGLARNFLVLTGLLTIVLGGLVYGLSRRGYTPARLFSSLVRLPRRIVFYTQLALVALATRGDQWFQYCLDRVRTTASYLRQFFQGQISASALRTAFLGWLTVKRHSLMRLLGRDHGAERGGPKAVPESGAKATVRQAWRRFLTYVSMDQPGTQTPGELAAHAIERDGLPAEPVCTLRDTFRAVEYGSRPASDRLEQVAEALDAIERHERTPVGEDE
jgi:hypothetical protein